MTTNINLLSLCRRTAVPALVAISGMFPTERVTAATITISPVNDTFIANYAVDSGANNGSSALLGASHYQYGSANQGEYSLLRFDFAGQLPVDAILESVTLRLTVTFSYNYNSIPEDSYIKLGVWQNSAGNSQWVQGNGTGTGATGQFENQTAPETGQLWTSGATMFSPAGGDVGAQLGLTPSLSAVTAGEVIEIALDTAKIQLWLTDPALQEAGLVFHATRNVQTFGRSEFLYFNSSRTATGPQLMVNYTAVPEPTTAAMMLLGGAFILIRYWRKSDEPRGSSCVSR